MGDRMRILPTAAAVAILVSAGACGRASAPSAESADRPTTTGHPSTSAAPRVAGVLDDVVLTDADLGPGLHLTPYIDGDVVDGQVTLDYCDGDFPSESTRTARHQDSIVSGATQVASVEAVQYEDAAAAEQALVEVRAAIANCPADTYVAPLVEGVPPMAYDMAAVPDDALGPLATDHVAVAGSVTTDTGETSRAALVYQRRGRVMVAVYGTDPASIAPFTALVAAHLAALSPEQAGE